MLNTEKLPEDAINRREIIIQGMRAASAWRRLFNHILDVFLYYVFGTCFMVFGTVLCEAFLSHRLAMLVPSLLGIPVYTVGYMVYLILFEYMAGRTLGKALTRTKVIRPDGTPPSFWSIVGRNFARLIPFEFFSFLTSRPVGLHDVIAHTMVVRDIDLYDFGTQKTLRAQAKKAVLDEGY